MRTHSLRSLNTSEGVRWYLETMSLRGMGPQLKLPINEQFKIGDPFHVTTSFLPVWPHTFVSSSAQEGQLSVTGESMCTKYWLTT